MSQKIAFKTYAQAPENMVPPGIPEEWPFYQTTISSDKEADFISAGFQVMTQSQFSDYKAAREETFHLWANQYDVDKTSNELRVLDYVADEFKNLPPSKIDFRMHLIDDVYLQKQMIMLQNGRPQKALYTYDGVLIAEIEFSFEVNAFNFVTRRIENLSYYKRNGEKLGPWILADDVYNQNDPYDLSEMMKERSGARARIIEEVKAFLNGVLAQVYIPQGKTYPEILAIAGDFWEKFNSSISGWINVGSPTFAQALIADTDFDFLSFEISQGVTVRDYVLNRISY